MSDIQEKLIESELANDSDLTTLVRSRSLPHQRPQSEPERGRSSLAMHNVVVDGRRTTVRLEPAIWDVLRDIADQQEVTVHNLVSAINKQHIASSLSSAIRAYVVVYLSAKLPDTPLAPWR